MAHACEGCLYFRVSLDRSNHFCMEQQRAAVGRCDRYAPAPDYTVCRGCAYALWHYANWRFCALHVDLQDGRCADFEPLQAPEVPLPCDGCQHLWVAHSGARTCSLTPLRRSPVRCRQYTPGPDYAVCRGCAHAAWVRPDLCRCRRRLTPENGACPGFERAAFLSPPCPECGAALARNDGHMECPAGHRWRVRATPRSVCPTCGGSCLVFGAQATECERRVVRFCPRCGWSAVGWRYVGPPKGRKRHGGQHWSPTTGRLLVSR